MKKEYVCQNAYKSIRKINANTINRQYAKEVI